MERKKIFVGLLVSTLLITSTNGIAAAASTTNIIDKMSANSSNSDTSKKSVTSTKVVHTLGNLSPIKITARSSVSLTDVNILSQDDGNVVTYTLTYKNNDSKPMIMLDYWSKVKTKGGDIIFS